MNIKNFYTCFSDEELCEGAELVLSGEAKCNRQPMTANDFTSFVKKIKSGGEPHNAFFHFEEGRYFQLSSSTAFENYTGSRSKNFYQSSMVFDREKEMVLSTSCTCKAFEKDHYGCPHLAAALTSFYMEEEGQEFFRETRLEESLREISGADDPFTPGALKRTDSRLRDFLQVNQEENALPVWEEKAESNGNATAGPQLHCECSILEIENQRYLELKAGASRSYVVKDLSSFMQTYRKGGIYTLGRNDYVLCEESFRKDCLPLLDFIISTEERVVKFSSPYVSFGISHDLRYLRLDDYDMSKLLEILDGTEISFSDGKKIPVQLDRKGIHATLRKKGYGAALKLKPVQIFCEVFGSFCLMDDEGIFCVKTYGNEGDLLRSLLASSQEAYIRESDIPAFLSHFLPFFERKGNLTVKGIQPDSYQKESPEFVLYLDLEGDQTISCQPYSVYSDPEVRYPLFDNQTGSLRRNGPEETAFAQKLIDLFESYEPTAGKLYVSKTEKQLFEFLQKVIPDLQKESTIFISDRLKRIKVRKLPSLSVDVVRQSSSLLMSIQADSLTKEEMQQILNAYSPQKKYFRLKDGSFFDFEDTDSQVWDTLSDFYQHYGKKDPKLFSVPIYRSLYLDEMLSDRKDLVLNGDEHYKHILQASKVENDEVQEVPDSLKGVLRPYQEEGFRWICRLKEMGFGGILADDMGLGKTLQVLTFLLAEKTRSCPPRDVAMDSGAGKMHSSASRKMATDSGAGKMHSSASPLPLAVPAENGNTLSENSQPSSGPSLIVCPASLVYNWKKELERFTPQLSSVMIIGTQAERCQKIEDNKDTDVWITSYDLLKRDIAFYEGISFSHEIVDEAQYIKNQSTQAAKSVRTIHAGFRMALTGTPIENRLSELWSIMDYLMPGFLYPYTRFQKEFELPISQANNSDILDRLRRMVHPFILRRLKGDVLKELPEKQEEVISVRMEEEQQKIYDAFAANLRLSLEKTSDKDFGSSKIQVLAEITKLRQICCDPSLVSSAYHGESAKLEACMELVKQAVEGGHKLLLFSQFTSMLDIICTHLTSENIAYYRLDGSTSKEKRMEMVDNFASDEVPVFCISLKAGGTGLNLTAADIVIHYDPWWNQAAQNQATDRAHRIGQKHKVTVYELVAKNTLEERIQEIKSEKTKLMQDVLSGETISSTDFNRSELLGLL